MILIVSVPDFTNLFCPEQTYVVARLSGHSLFAYGIRAFSPRPQNWLVTGVSELNARFHEM